MAAQPLAAMEATAPPRQFRDHPSLTLVAAAAAFTAPQQQLVRAAQAAVVTAAMETPALLV
jgi:hypothetical protein